MAGHHLINAACAISPRSQYFGPIVSRIPITDTVPYPIALTFDDGPDPNITPQVLDILDAHHAKASFFCIAEHAQKYPQLVRDILTRGHTVGNHSYKHSNLLGLYGPTRLKQDIHTAQHLLADITGVLPRWYRPPFGVRTPFTQPVLAHLGLSCVGWTTRSYDTVDHNVERIVQRVLRRMPAGSIVLLHDGRAGHPHPKTRVCDALPHIIQALYKRNARPLTLDAAFPQDTH